MTREQAIRKLRALYGKAAYWRVSDEITSPEKRAAAREECLRLRAEAAAIDEEVKQRLIDTGIQARIDAARALRQRASNLAGHALHYRFNVGKCSGFANAIAGQGDTWEEAIAQAQRREEQP